MLVEAPTSCICCGSGRIMKMGEGITETLEVVPRQWKVIQTVRDKFSCRDCERISQPPAPFHPTPCGWAGPNFLAMVLFEQFGQHQPLHGQATERLHGDDTSVPLMAKGGSKKALLWTWVRDDRPFTGGAPPVALYYFSTDRRMEHPTRYVGGWTGVLQADEYGGYNDLYLAQRQPAPVASALCWSHARRKFFELADIKEAARKKKKVAEVTSPLALEAMRRIDESFAQERALTGQSSPERHSIRQHILRPMVEEMYDWMRRERSGMSRQNPVGKAIDYMIGEKGRRNAFARLLDDGRTCLTNNAAERALRGVALGRKAWLFAGSPRGGNRAAFMYSRIVTAKMNDVDPQAWLADVLARLPNMPVSRLQELLPWNWTNLLSQKAA